MTRLEEKESWRLVIFALVFVWTKMLIVLFVFEDFDDHGRFVLDGKR